MQGAKPGADHIDLRGETLRRTKSSYSPQKILVVAKTMALVDALMRKIAERGLPTSTEKDAIVPPMLRLLPSRVGLPKGDRDPL